MHTKIGDTKMSDKSFYNAFGELGYLRQKTPKGVVFRYFGTVTIEDFA